MIGETFGSYRVTEKIGEGGMGAVYLAEHKLIGRKAAVKVLLPEHSRKPDLVDRFFNEAKTAAGLNHPALVDVFDFGVHASGSAYLVMDFLDGESLGNRLTRVAPVPAEVAVDLTRQIARGMEAAHSRGIVHRDLKPDNIFLVPDAENPSRDQVKILDFGIAKLLGTPSGSKGATSTGMVLGTPLFMAPEQCRGTGTIDHRADIYSLGCILYSMLCGRPPFAYEGVGEILGAHLHEPVTPPRTINPTVPEALDAVVMKALAKNPEERYQTMAALSADLARVPGSSQVVAQAPLPATMALPTAPGATTFSKAAAAIPAITPPPAAPPQRRRLVVPIAIAGAFAAGLVLGGVALLRARPSARPAPPLATTTANQPPTAVAAPVKSAPAAPTTAHAPASATAPASGPPAGPTPAPAPAATAVPAVVAHDPAATPGRVPPAASQRERPAQAAREPVDAYARGIAHLARGDEKHALESFRAYLRGSALQPARRAEAEGYVLSLQRKFGEIEVTCDRGAEVALDGRSVGRCPLTGGLFLLPGGHELAVTKEGYEPRRKAFRISAGDRLPFFFRLAP
jgi:tRNA A-37 threonylcarbamoyl transferase component Bud32